MLIFRFPFSASQFTIPRMIKTFLTICCGAFALLLCACSAPIPKNTVDLYLEAPARSASFGLHKSFAVNLGNGILINAKIIQTPIATIDDFTNVTFGAVEIPEFDAQGRRVAGNQVPGIRVFTDTKARYKIFSATEDARAKREGIKRVFLFANGQPIGYFPIFDAIRRDYLDFIVFMDPTMPDEEKTRELEDIKFRLNEYILAYREYVKNQK